MLGGTQDRAAERVVAEHRPIDQMLGDHRRLIFGARDLLHDDPALTVELVGIDPGSRDEVGQQVGRLEQPLGPGGDVERDEIVAGIGVEHRADRLGGLVDVPVVGVFLAALEDEMLEEVGHPVLIGALGPGAGVERGQQRDGAGAGDRDPVYAEAIGQR